jgi:cytosine/adenosine deaminase-related metal-dependent hydrolase
MPPVQLLREQHANIVIGTDSYASNWSLNLLDELKRIQLYNSQIPLAEMLTWITSNGARALQMDDKLGSIELGKRPGLVLIKNLSSAGQLETKTYVEKII